MDTVLATLNTEPMVAMEPMARRAPRLLPPLCQRLLPRLATLRTSGLIRSTAKTSSPPGEDHTISLRLTALMTSNTRESWTLMMMLGVPTSLRLNLRIKMPQERLPLLKLLPLRSPKLCWNLLSKLKQRKSRLKKRKS